MKTCRCGMSMVARVSPVPGRGRLFACPCCDGDAGVHSATKVRYWRPTGIRNTPGVTRIHQAPGVIRPGWQGRVV